jgi:hypothetical protein
MIAAEQDAETDRADAAEARAEMAEVELAVTRNGSRLALAEARIQVLTEALERIVDDAREHMECPGWHAHLSASLAIAADALEGETAG